MPDEDSGPQLKPGDTIRFLETCRPTLEDGEYRVTAKHTLAVNGNVELDAARSLMFVVAGPRFVLAPSEVVSRFPPQGARGAFSTVLPHVMLARPSLPWERSAASDADDDPNRPPWLALLVLAEDEVKTTTTVAAKELMTATTDDAAPPPQPPFAILPRQPGDRPDQPVAMIEIDAALAREILPKADELPLLTGVRDVNGNDGRALVIANRLPRPGTRNIVHLVSLEGQYRPVSPAPKSGPAYQHWADRLTTGTLRLLSLAQWAFDCSDAGGDLADILKHITIGEFRLSADTLGSAFGPAQAGAIPVEYRLATGQRTAAWYHGPLAVSDHAANLALPARLAKDLVRTEAATGMADISYAAAWEIGRMLALCDPAVGIPLYQWKRNVAQANHSAQWVATAPEAMPTNPASPVFALAKWFETALARLASVPFAYLVPEPALLPAETLCLFTLDRQWIAALFDGAFSIGRSSTKAQNADAILRGVLPAIGDRSGILLRSAAVAGWPDLVVDGTGANNQSLSLVRCERLASDTLLVLFEGVLAFVRVHPHPQALHFGFDGDGASSLTKLDKTITVKFRDGATSPADSDERVIDIGSLARDLGTPRSSDFAAKMIELPPRVSYSVRKDKMATHG